MRQPVRVVLADDHDAFVEGLGMVLSAEGDLEIVALAGDGASALQAVLTHRPDVLVVDTHMPGPAVPELVRLIGQAEPATRVLLLAEDARPEPSSEAGQAGMTRAVSARELAQAIRAVAAGFRVVAADPPVPLAPPPSPAPPAPPAPQGSPNPGHIGAPEREGNRQPEGARTAVHTLWADAVHTLWADAVHTPWADAVQAPGADAVQAPGMGGARTPGTAAGHSPAPAAAHDPGQPGPDQHAELLLRSLSERERQILGLLARGYSNRRIAEACFLSLNTVRTHVQNVLVKLGVHSKLEAAALAVRQGLVRTEDHPA
jgi:DNA-binding NarL/FixJ family response regulator